MNITEANAVGALLGFLAGWHQDRDRALDAAAILDERAAKALGVAPNDIRSGFPVAVQHADGPIAEVATEWCAWHGGEDLVSCAGLEVFDDQAEAEEAAQWLIESGVAWRNAYRTPWTAQADA